VGRDLLCLRKGRTTLDRESWFCLNARLCGNGFSAASGPVTLGDASAHNVNAHLRMSARSFGASVRHAPDRGFGGALWRRASARAAAIVAAESRTLNLPTEWDSERSERGSEQNTFLCDVVPHVGLPLAHKNCSVQGS